MTGSPSMIRRSAALERIRTALRRNPVAVLTGPRQCGKTTLARQLLAEDSANYFDLEDPVSLARLDEPITALGPLRGLVVIDEAHDEAWFWATHQGAEIDLLLRRGDRLLGVECKRADAPRMTPSIRIAKDDLGLDQVAVVYPGNKRYTLADRVEAVPLATLARPGSLFGEARA